MQLVSYMKIKVLALTGLFLAVVGFNAQAVDVRVKGAIVPASCNFTVTNAVIDYGRVDPATLSPTHYTKLAEKSTPYSIRCSSGTQLAVTAVDNRAASKVPNMMVSQYDSTFIDTFNFGLGTTTANQKIGGYIMQLRNSTADGRAVLPLFSSTNGRTWGRGVGTLGQSGHLTSWYSGVLTPVRVSVVSGNLYFQAVINKASELNLRDEVRLDGHATLELRYL